MSQWNNKLTDIRNAMIDLYPNRDDGQMMVDMAGFPTSGIDFSGSSKAMWYKILKEALKRKKVSDLVQIALEEYPENEELSSIFTEVEEKEPLTSVSNLNAELYSDYLKEASAKMKPKFRGDSTNELSEKFNDKYREFEDAKLKRGEGLLDKISYRAISDEIEEAVASMVNDANLEVLKPLFRSKAPMTRSVQNYDILVPGKKGLEKVVGSDDITDLIWWIEKAKETSMAVCKIETSTGESGTGFLLKGGYIMTNNHVIPSAGDADKTRIIFNHKVDKDKNVLDRVVYSLDSSNFLTSHEDELDYTIVKVKDNDEQPLSKWGNVEIEDFLDPNVNEKVTIIQHPNGNYMKMAFPDNIISVWGKYLFYVTDTKEGSSGSPVFNKEWRVVALHHAGKNEGSSEGGMQINEAGDIKPSNRGILIKTILEDLKEREFTHSFI